MQTFQKSRFLATLLSAGAMALVTVGTAQAWEAPYVEKGIKNAIEAAKKLKDMSGFGARSDGICLIGGFMEVHGEITWTVSLKAGKEYIFVGAGDDDVKDLDLEAWEGDKLVAHDSLEDNTPVVALTVQGDCEIKLKLKLAKAPAEGQKHFNVLIMLENKGTGGSLDQLEHVAKQLNDACTGIKDKGDLQFDQEVNTVCIVGCLLEQGGSRSFDRNFSKDSHYIMVGAGDQNCTDLDLEVRHDDKIIAHDSETDATPVVGIEVTDKDVRCNVKMIMHESKKASFAVVALLTKK